MKELDINQIAIAQALINKRPPGLYELKEIFGSEWATIDNPTDYGTKFKYSVKNNLLKNITLDAKKSNNHQNYKIG